MGYVSSLFRKSIGIIIYGINAMVEFWLSGAPNLDMSRKIMRSIWNDC